MLGASERDWISAWVAERIASGSLWRERWIGFVTSISDEMKQQLLDRIEGEDIQQARRGDPAALLGVVADSGMVQRLFRRLIERVEVRLRALGVEQSGQIFAGLDALLHVRGGGGPIGGIVARVELA